MLSENTQPTLKQQVRNWLTSRITTQCDVNYPKKADVYTKLEADAKIGACYTKAEVDDKVSSATASLGPQISNIQTSIGDLNNILNGNNIITSTEDVSAEGEARYVLNHEASLAGKKFRFTCDLTVEGEDVTLTLTNTFPASFEGTGHWDCFVPKFDYAVGGLFWEAAGQGQVALTFATNSKTSLLGISILLPYSIF